MNRLIRPVLAACLFVSPLCAQETAPPPEASPAKSPAHVRVWAMVFGEKTPFAVKTKTKEGEPMTLLDTPGDKPTKGFYAEVPKGPTELTIVANGLVADTKTVDLVANDYRTILVRRKGARLVLEVLQDPLPGQKDFPPTLRLLNFGTGRVAEVTIGTEGKVLVPDNDFLIKPITQTGEVPLSVVLPDPTGGPPAISSTDIDTRTSPSWSVVTIPDYRGKLRPRVSPDGKE
jgi:hypothetical protein